MLDGYLKTLGEQRMVGMARLQCSDVVRYVLGAILLVAAGLKAHELAMEPQVSAGVLEARWLLIAVVEGEILFGIWLVAGTYGRWSWAVATTCFAVFACVSVYKALSGETSCGCFGRFAVNPWYTLVLDVCAVAALARWRPKRVDEQMAVRWSPRFAVIVVVWVAVAIPAAVVMAGPKEVRLQGADESLGDDAVVVLEAERWIGKRFPLSAYVRTQVDLRKGTWTILLYRHDCADCEKAIARLVRAGIGRDSGNVLLVEVPPFGDLSGDIRVIAGTLPSGRLIESKEWFVITPVTIKLRDGVVVSVDSNRGGA